MTYAVRREQVFALPDPTYPDCTPLKIKRSDHKLKRFPSNFDHRTWNISEEQQYRALYDLVSGSQTCLEGSDLCHKYVPLEDLIKILTSEKDELIRRLREQLECCNNQNAAQAKMADKIAALTEELNNSREMLRKAMHKLQNIDEIVNENKKLHCRLRCSEERIKLLEEKKKCLESELEDLRSKSQILIDLEQAQKMLQEVTEMGDPCQKSDVGTLTSERDRLQEKVKELERELEESKKREAQLENLKGGLDEDEISLENECYKKKLASMRCLEKQIQELKKDGRALADKYKREAQKAAEQMNRMCQTAKELKLLREERDSLRKRVKELSCYENQYNALQRKLRSVEEVIAENECLNSKIMALENLEKENEYLRSQLNKIQKMEDSAAEDKERILQLQCAVADQEEEMKELLCQIGRLTSGTHEEEIERLRCELCEKNSKLKLCEEQLAEIPMLEAEIDELRTKLQICCREFPEKKTGKSKCQRIEVRLPSANTGICAKYKSSSFIKRRCEEKYGDKREQGPCEKINLESTRSAPCTQSDKMTCEEVQNLLQSSKGIISCVLDDMVEHQKEMEELEKRNKAMKCEIEMLKAKVGTSQGGESQEVTDLRQALEDANREISRLKEAGGSSEEDVELLKKLNVEMKEELQAACEGLKQVSLLEEKLKEERKARCQAERQLKSGRVIETGGLSSNDVINENFENEPRAPNGADDFCSALQMECDDLKMQIVELNNLIGELKKENGLLRELQKPSPDFSKELEEKCALENLLSLLQAELDSYKGQKLSNECEALRKELKRIMEQNCQLKVLVDCYRQRLELEKQTTRLAETVGSTEAASGYHQGGVSKTQPSSSVTPDKYSGTPGATPEKDLQTSVGTPGAVSGGTPGAVSGGTPGAVSGGTPGAVSGGTPGAVSGGTPGAVSGGTPGAVSGGTPGPVPGGTPGKDKACEEELSRLRQELADKDKLLKAANEETKAARDEAKAARDGQASAGAPGQAPGGAPGKDKACEEELSRLRQELADKDKLLKAANEETKAARDEAKAARDGQASAGAPGQATGGAPGKDKACEEELSRLRQELADKDKLLKAANEETKAARDEAKAARDEAKAARDGQASAGAPGQATGGAPGKDKACEEELSRLRQELADKDKLLKAANEETKAARDEAKAAKEKQNEAEAKAAGLAGAQAATPSAAAAASEDEVARLRELLKNMEKENAEKVKALMDQHQKELNNREKAYNDNLNAMKAGYETDIRKLADRHKQSVVKLQELHEDEVKELNTTHESQMEMMQTQSEAAIKDVAKGTAAKIKKMSSQYAKDMEEKNRQLDAMKEKLGSKVDLDALQAKHSREMNSMKRGSQRKLSLLKEKLMEEKRKSSIELGNLKKKLKESGLDVSSRKKPRDPCAPLDFMDVIQKILEEGLESLSFNEIALVHRKACCALERIVMESDVTPSLEPAVGDHCVHVPLLEADKQQLLRKIFLLQNEIQEKQRQTQETIINMEVAIKKERSRLLDLKNLLIDAQRKNSELKMVIHSQSQMQMNLKKERDELGNEASVHKSLCAEKSKQLDEEMQSKKSLESEVERLKAQVKQLCFALEMARGPSTEDCQRNDQIKALQLKLEQAKNLERKLACQLENEAKYRAQLQCQVQTLRQSFKQMVCLPAVENQIRVPENPLDAKSAKEMRNLDQVKEKKTKSKPSKKHKK